MQKPPPILGHTIETPDDHVPVTIDLEEMIGTDTCIIAKKGFGKSGALRVLFEQTYSLIQQIIIDPEGEFYTLREKFEYLVAGGESGDCPATPANAAALARMLMDNPGISAVIQLDHLIEEGEPERFVQLFLEELMRTPKASWHPVMVCVDETQRFAPQDSVVASSAAMKDLTRRGRKRGITPVFATLRNAAINKDLTDGVSNWLFGRVGTDIDRRLVANSLAFASSSTEAKGLPTLPKRAFWGVGPAISDQPVLFRVADAQTTIVKSGGMVEMPPPPESLGKLLEALSKAAAPVVAPEASGAAPGASAGQTGGIHQPSFQKGYDQGHVDGYEKGIGVGYDKGAGEAHSAFLEDLETWIADRRENMLLGDINVGVDDRDHVVGLAKIARLRVPTQGAVKAPAARLATAEDSVAANPAAASTNSAGLSLLEALTKHHPMRLTWAQIAGFSGRKARGGSFNSARRWLLDQGLIVENGDIVEATAAGLALKPAPETSLDKIESWAEILPAPADQLLRYLVDHPGITPLELAEATGRQPRGGSWHTAMRHLKTNNLVEEVDGHLSPSPWLFD